ncbi:phospholipase D-like domain-containing protein [Shewanella gelidimarina]|uniref:phospholipase D-like domain-containing protein n=1 Tax=Shewanella gelidimarina TaxID=56813 RepID=UPI00200E496A|nr:phospholipase D-like domain-containing protein [Shewanella gelidimarina]MCL1056831.1 phospholipase D-like domain-containing protein [Shewanella gelidimarina]
MELYLRNIAKRWKSEAHSADQLIIFSPYISSKTADVVIEKAIGKKCVIYTLFSAELFINLSSSVSTLISLKKKGVTLYGLPKLHAKLVIVPGVFASVGSQNLTARGTKNLEASIVITSKNKIDKLLLQTEEWTGERSEISLSMLEDMAKLIKPFVKIYKALINDAEAIDIDIKSLELERREEKEKLRLARVEEQRKLAERRRSLELLEEILSKQASQSEVVEGKVKWVENNPDTETKKYTSSFTFTSNSKCDFTRWSMNNDDVVRLARIYRYLFLLEDSGKIAWARVAKRRITYFCDGVSNVGVTVVKGMSCSVSFEANWDVDKATDANLTILIKHRLLDISVKCPAWFGVDSLNIRCEDMEVIDKQRNYFNLGYDMRDWIEENKDVFADSVLKVLLEPFVYKKKLTGSSAYIFLGDVGTSYALRAVKINDSPILVGKLI